MNRLCLHLALIMLAMAPLCAHAEGELQDTVFFFKSWDQVIYDEPASMLVNPYIYDQSRFQFFFEINDERMNYVIEHEFLAASLGDSIWFINSNYLKKAFKGDVDHLVGYIPMFFNNKMAYIIYGGYPYKDPYWKHDPYNREGSFEDFVWHYYYIDFVHHKVLKVDYRFLSDQLEDYQDLLMRYEGMKDNNKRDVIEYYFLKYIDRVSTDVMRPEILELVDDMEVNKN